MVFYVTQSYSDVDWLHFSSYYFTATEVLMEDSIQVAHCSPLTSVPEAVAACLPHGLCADWCAHKPCRVLFFSQLPGCVKDVNYADSWSEKRNLLLNATNALYACCCRIYANQGNFYNLYLSVQVMFHIPLF